MAEYKLWHSKLTTFKLPVLTSAQCVPFWTHRICPYDKQSCPFASMSGVTAATVVVLLPAGKHVKLADPLFEHFLLELKHFDIRWVFFNAPCYYMDSCWFSYNEIILTDISDQFNGLSIHSFQSIAPKWTQTVESHQFCRTKVLFFFNLSQSKATWITCPCRKNKDMERNHKFGGLVIHILPRQHESWWRSRDGCDLACKPGFEEECSHVGAIPYALLAAVNKRWLVHLISQQLSGIIYYTQRCSKGGCRAKVNSTVFAFQVGMSVALTLHENYGKTQSKH